MEKYDIVEHKNESFVDNKDLGAVASINSYNKNKRQIYIWPENKEFFDNLRNKSKFINLLIKKYRQEVGDTDGREIK